MKKKLVKWLASAVGSLALFGMLSMNSMAAGEGVLINEKNFPDEVFRQYISDNFDTDGNKGTLSEAEIRNINTINTCFYFEQLTSVKGIEHFPYLKELNIYYNDIAELDVSRNLLLEELLCYNCKLDKLDVSYNTKLVRLSCYNNNLSVLDISRNPELETLECYNNHLDTLDLTNNPNLLNVSCDENEMTELKLGNHPALRGLSLENNKVKSLNLSQVPNLYSINCTKNELEELDFSNCTAPAVVSCRNNKLTKLYFDNQTTLSEIYCQDNQLTELRIANTCKNFIILNCAGNQLTSLDLSVAPNLKMLYCEKNLLTSLDVTMLPQLGALTCTDNKLTSLDLSANQKLNSLSCNGNRLTRLDLNNNQNLMTFYCENNPLTALDLSKNTMLYTFFADFPVILKTVYPQTEDYLGIGAQLYVPAEKLSDGTTLLDLSGVAGFDLEKAYNFYNCQPTSVPYQYKKYDDYGTCSVDYRLSDVRFSRLVITPDFSAIPTILSQPEDVTTGNGGKAEFTVLADGEGLKYQWQKSTDGGKTWVNSSSTGAATETLSMTAKTTFNGYQFRCKITGRSGKAVYSDAATLIVAAGPVISLQPAAKSVKAGETVTFKVSATGDGLTYQWQKSTDGGKTWVNSASTGAKTGTLSMATKASYNGLQFRCKITDKSGKTVYSNAAKLTVTAAGPAITLQPAAETTVNGGETATFKVSATGEGLTYQWQKSTDSVTWTNSGSTGAKTTTLSMVTKVSYNGLNFRCKVTDKNGAVVYSAPAKLIVNQVTAPIVTSVTSENVTAQEGNTVALTIKAEGEELTYQWQKSKDLKTWANCASDGAKTDTLTLKATAGMNQLNFRCIVTNKAGLTTSSNLFYLTVNAAALPVIKGQPMDWTVQAGEQAEFSIMTSGSNLTYQWQKSIDGGKTWVNSASTGAKTSKLTMTAKESFNGYQFRCVVKNALGKSVTSNAAVLTVKKASGPALWPVSYTEVSAVNGEQVKFAVTTMGFETVTYQWQKSTDGGKTWVNSGSTGAKSDELTMTVKTSYSGLKFRCVVTNQAGASTISEVITLTVE